MQREKRKQARDLVYLSGMDEEVCMCALYVCLICMPYIYAFSGMDEEVCMCALCVCLICMPYTAWTKRCVCVCVCVPCMYAIHEVCVCALLSGCVQLCVCVQTAIGKLVIAYDYRQASYCVISHARPYMMTDLVTNDDK